MKKLLKWICQQKGAVYQEETIDFPLKGPNYVSTMINQIQLNNKKKTHQNPELDFLVAIANLKFHYRTSAFPVWLIDVLSFVHDRCTGNISLKSALLCALYLGHRSCQDNSAAWYEIGRLRPHPKQCSLYTTSGRTKQNLSRPVQYL